MKNNKKLVTVIIPVYNCERYLVECFDSVIKQSIGFDNIEMIIVNDGSTDGSAKIIDQYKKRYSNITVINQKNAGLSAARNAGLGKVKTDFITYFDSDDILPETALEDLVNTAIKNNSDIVIGGMENFTSAGHKPNYTTKYLKDYDRISYKKNIHLLEFVHACGKLYRTSFVAKKRFIVGTKHEDNYYTLSLYLSTDNISMINKTVYCRRDREGGEKSIMQSLDYRSFCDLLHNYDEALNECSYNSDVLKLVIKKIYSYIAKRLAKTDIGKALKKANQSCDIFINRCDCSSITKKYLKIKKELYSVVVKVYRRTSKTNESFDRSMPLVSVIIPTYRRADYIGRAIESVLKQTYKNIEIIVVDDNNDGDQYRTDTEMKMKKYIDSQQVKYVKHKHNKNGASARNTGIAICSGEYITFLDDDDFFLDNRIETLVEKMNQLSEYGCAYTNVATIRNGRLKSVINVKKSGNYTRELLVQRPFLGTGSNMFFRASVIRKMGGFDTSFKRGQDIEVMLRYFRDYDILKVHNCSVVKDDSDRTNMKNAGFLLDAREHFFDVFKCDIEKQNNKKRIYGANYNSLLRIARGQNDRKAEQEILSSAEKRLGHPFSNDYLLFEIRRAKDKIRSKIPSIMSLKKNERKSLYLIIREFKHE